MRDIVVLLFLLGGIAAAIRAPWLGVLALAVLSYLNPHAYAWGFMMTAPVYHVLFLTVVLSFLIQGKSDYQPIPKDWRIPAFYFLWFFFFLTTLDALIPKFAWPRLMEISKIYLPFIFTLWLINTRRKLFYLIATIAASVGLIAVKGGIWAIGTGFSHRVYGPPRTQFYDNNQFALATLIVIPLVILWLREVKDWRLKFGLTAAIPLMFAAAISSHSRGALVTMGVLVPVLLWNSKRKWLAVPFLLVGLVVAAQNLPEKWFDRMATIDTYEEDQSAMGRIEVWQDGIGYALRNPLTGGGFEAWWGITMRDFHSSYVEILAEHGFIAFFLWIALLYGSIISLTRLPRRTRHVPGLEWVANYAYMVRAGLIAYAVGTLFLGLTYWDLLYHLIFVSVLIKKLALEELAAYNATTDTTEDPRKGRDLQTNAYY